MKKFPGIVVLMMICLLNPSLAVAQDGDQTLAFSPESTITVDGTSNRDDWSVTAQQFEGYVILNEYDEAIPEIAEARLNVKAQEMAGGRSSIMDRLMRDALQASEHSDIEFVLTGINTEPNPENSGLFNVLTTGELTLAGVTRSVEVALEGAKLDNGTYQFTGSHPLLMSDYGITPPTAMFGALVTGDEVVVHFDILTEGE